MGKPELKNASVMDKSGVAEPGEGTDELENASDKENDDSFDEQGGDTDADGRAEDQEAGGDADPVEGEEGEENENSEPEPKVDAAADRERLKTELREELKKDLLQEQDMLRKQNEEQAPVKELSDEEWAAHEQRMGVPRTAIRAFTEQNVKLFHRMNQILDERFSRFEKREALTELAQDPAFRDAKRYQKDVDEFLTDYDVKHHSNPKLLQRAVIYARGKNAQTNLNKVRNDKTRNLKITGSGRPAGNGAPVRKAGNVALTPLERSAARAAGMSESEYLKSKNSGRVIA